jgi:hypothetical protein
MGERIADDEVWFDDDKKSVDLVAGSLTKFWTRQLWAFP